MLSHYAHLLAAERTYEAGGPHRWRCPIAERIADEVARLRDQHPVAAAWKIDSAGLWLALQGVSAAVGRAGIQIERGYSGFMPDEFGSTPANHRRSPAPHSIVGRHRPRQLVEQSRLA
jgi:hypothetical protein